MGFPPQGEGSGAFHPKQETGPIFPKEISSIRTGSR